MFDGGSKKKDQAKNAVSPDIVLVQHLTSHHRALLETYEEIHNAVSTRKYGTVARHATEFHDRLHKHLHKENMEFYTKLKNHLQKIDAEQRQVVHELQRQMYSIGVGAIDFIRQARFLKLTNENAGRFRTELESVGSVLVTRIRKEEEELYPLYLRFFG